MEDTVLSERTARTGNIATSASVEVSAENAAASVRAVRMGSAAASAESAGRLENTDPSVSVEVSTESAVPSVRAVRMGGAAASAESAGRRENTVPSETAALSEIAKRDSKRRSTHRNSTNSQMRESTV